MADDVEPTPDTVVDLSDSRRRRRWFGRRHEADTILAETLVQLRPAPRDVPSTAVALEMARDWMRYFAFVDATISSGPQPMINASRGLAHLVGDPRGVGTREVMEAHKLAVMADKYALVFSLGGFSAGAIRWANRNTTALFEFDHHGQVTPVSDVARRLLERSDRRHLAVMEQSDLDDQPGDSPDNR